MDVFRMMGMPDNCSYFDSSSEQLQHAQHGGISKIVCLKNGSFGMGEEQQKEE